jgi:hypothetical protein
MLKIDEMGWIRRRLVSLVNIEISQEHECLPGSLLVSIMLSLLQPAQSVVMDVSSIEGDSFRL